MEDGSEYQEEGVLQFSEYAVEESTGSVTLRALLRRKLGRGVRELRRGG